MQMLVFVHFEQPGNIDSHWPVAVLRQVSKRHVVHFFVPRLQAVHFTPQFVHVFRFSSYQYLSRHALGSHVLPSVQELQPSGQERHFLLLGSR